MHLSDRVLSSITNAENRSLATAGTSGVTAVPVSMVVMEGDTVMIADCFMDKTAANAKENGRAAVSFWRGFAGVQIRGPISYEAEGRRFDDMKLWLQGKHPDRTLKGVVVIEAEEAYDLAPERAGQSLG